jgi:putative SOS response-associated peptidase YedK
VCGRFVRFSNADVIGELYGLRGVPTLEPGFNIAPSESVLAIRNNPDTGEKEAVTLKWGLVPRWAKDPAIGNKMINARAETAADKPSFRDAMKKRRCLIITDGFYEWRRKPPPSQPFYFKLVTGGPFTLAGLWERWQDPKGVVLESCAILTTAANGLMAPVHDRMPVIVDPDDYARWLDPGADVEKITDLLKPASEPLLESFPVSRAVNSPANNGPDLIAPAQ